MLPRAVRSALDRIEPIVELLIRACGWSAIFFVFCIFIFIFREGGPFLWNRLRTESVPAEEAEAGSPRLILTDLPHEMPEGRLLAKIAEAREEGKLPSVEGASLETEPAVHVELSLAPGTDPEAAKEELLEAIPLRRDASHLVQFFTSTEWRPDSEIRRSFGILALIIGSLSVTLLALSISVPFSLGAAIYISEFCAGKTRETLKILIELLAAIPSIVWGFIGIKLMNPIIIAITGQQPGLNLLNGGVVLAFMSMPIIVSLAEDSLKAVPDSYREAAVALGATRWQRVYRVLLPASKTGLLAAVLLGFGRCIGETMAVLMVTGHAINIPGSLLDPVRTMTATIAAELGDSVRGGSHYESLFLIGMVLMTIAFCVNLLADIVVRGVRGKQDG